MKKLIFGALVLLLPISAAALLFGRTKKTSANSAPPYWYGSDTAGAILAGDDCPIEVKHETLTLSVPKLSHLDGYGTVTAEYEFFNPTEEDITATLVFPMGTAPDYVATEEFTDSEQYSITADGEPVEAALRYTRNPFWTDRRTFNIEEGIRELYPEEDPFYKDDLPVYVHTVEATVPYRSENNRMDWVNLAIYFEGSAKNTRVFSTDGCNFFTDDGRGKLLTSYSNQEGATHVFTFYAVGEDITISSKKVFRYNGNEKTEDKEARFFEKPIPPTTFSSLVESLCRLSGGQNFIKDWRNAFISLLEENKIAGTCMCPLDFYALDGSNFLCWYEYSLTVPAGETVVNAVTAPLFPDVDQSSSQSLYEYVYLLSPASKWAKFEGIDITIETPFYLSDGTLHFDKTENGYAFSRDSLPMGELRFTLTESERVYPVYRYPGGDDNDSLITAIVLLCIAAAVIAVVVTVIVVRMKKRKKSREEEERRLRMGTPQEGRVDLPPSPAEKTPSGPSEGPSEEKPLQGEDMPDDTKK